MNEGITVINENDKPIYMSSKYPLFDERIDIYSLGVYNLLAYYRGKGIQSMSYGVMVDLLGISRDRIMKSINILQDCGYLSVEKSPGQPNRYTLFVVGDGGLV